MLVDLDPMFLMSDRGKKLRPGGTLSMEIFQAAFHGARGCFLSDLRQAVSGDRRYDGAVVSHSGRTDTRICEEVEQIGRLLTELTEMTSTKVAARCAVLCGDEAGKDRAFRIWRSLRSLGTSVDVIDGSMDYEGYAFVAACGFRRVSEENAERIRSYIEAGGIFLAEWGFATEDLIGSCYTGEVPHSLTDVFGIRIAEKCIRHFHQIPKTSLGPVIFLCPDPVFRHSRLGLRRGVRIGKMPFRSILKYVYRVIRFCICICRSIRFFVYVCR